MIKDTSSYTSFKTDLVVRNLIAFCFMLFILMQPVITFSSTLSEEKQELTDGLEKNNTEEKEDVIELDVKIIHQTTSSIKSQFSHLLLAIITTQENSLSGCFEIQLPPPKL